MTDIKPCPFCGGEAETLKDFDCLLSEWQYYIQCKKCYSSSHLYKTDDEAIAAWNRRAKEGDNNG